jgi:Flp pilus assembly protein TadD
LALALAHTKKGGVTKAITYLEKSVALDPQSPEVHCKLGQAYYNHDLFGKAISEFKKAVELKPDYAEAYYNLAVSHAANKDWVMARRFTQKAQELEYPIEEEFLKSIEQGPKP